MAYLHRQKVTHHDIKPHNIMLDEERGPVLVDFEFGFKNTETSRTIPGATDWYRPPDMRSHRVFDVFCLGVVIMEILYKTAGHP